jgi:hypothetical protein
MVFDVPSGKHVILPEATDFSACAAAIAAEVDLSGKQDAAQALTDLASATPATGDVLKFDGANWAADTSAIEDSLYAKLNATNVFDGAAIQLQNVTAGSTSYTITRVFDATSTDDTEFSLLSILMDAGQVHNVECRVVAVGHNGATTVRNLTCLLCNSNGTLNQSNDLGDAGLFPISLGKCEFDVASNNLRLRIQGVSGLNIRYHAKVEIMSVSNISP